MVAPAPFSAPTGLVGGTDFGGGSYELQFTGDVTWDSASVPSAQIQFSPDGGGTWLNSVIVGQNAPDRIGFTTSGMTAGCNKARINLAPVHLTPASGGWDVGSVCDVEPE